MLIVLIRGGSELFGKFDGDCKVKGDIFKYEFIIHWIEVVYNDVFDIFIQVGLK